MSDPRLTAALILQQILEKKVFASEAKACFEPSEQDNAFVNMLVLTSLRRLVFIKKILKRFVQKKLPPRATLAQYMLILGTSEILYLKTPDYAVINSYVEIVKTSLDKYVAGFVNAVLRRICAARQQLATEDNGQFFPSEFRRLLNLSYSPKITSRIEKAALEEPLLDLSAKENPERIAAELNARLLPDGTLRLKNNGAVSALPGYSEGKWWVQDFSSALPVKLLPEVKGKRILDLCAAPGGKTAQLLSLGGEVTAVDISAVRLERLRENLRRLKLSPREIICSDASLFLSGSCPESYDIIVLDAPCSATGTLRRHPELVHIKNLNDAERLAPLQAELLEQAAPTVISGGFLLYCTCSLSCLEGEKQISAFLEKHSGFHIIRPALPAELSELITPEGCVRVLPCHLQTYGGADGFFAALLQKD